MSDIDGKTIVDQLVSSGRRWKSYQESLPPEGATVNQVPLVVDTNYGPHGIQSSQFYDHFSLLESLEAAFGLPCLNHACDPDVNVMSDLFQDYPHRHRRW